MVRRRGAFGKPPHERLAAEAREGGADRVAVQRGEGAQEGPPGTMAVGEHVGGQERCESSVPARSA